MDVSEGADDQGAGWLLVKKKHRSSSKFSVHNWVGGLSTKQKTSSPRSQPSPGVKLGCSNYNVQSSKASRDNLVFDPGVSVEESNLTAGSSQLPQEVNVQSHINNTNVPPKIKWGDLDDRTLLLHQGKSSGGDVKFGEIDSPHLVYRKSEDGNDFPYPPTDQKVSNIVGMAVVQDHPFQASHSLLANEKSSEDDEMQITDVKVFDPNGLNCNGHLIHKEPRGFDPSVQSKESFSSAVADVFLTAAVKHETDPLQVSEFSIDVNLKTVDFPPDALTLHPDKGAPGATVVHSPSREELSCAASEQGATVQASASGEGICSEVSEHVIGRDSSMMAIPQDCQLEEPNKTEPEVVAVSTISASKEDYKCQQDDVVLDNLTKTQITDHVNAHEDESKERFRERLWCFLFENLNRAIDELYLLCELECDLEQMKEGILVLEEAASDFRELNARVEEFEKVKKSSSHVLEGSPLTMKSDHRRPHALSWEVRRMTTSPRRAEILSSSLEAFRKIQQDRANACAGDAKLMGPDYRSGHCGSSSVVDNSNGKRDNRESMPKPRKQHIVSDLRQGKEEKNVDSNRCGYSSSKLPPKECYAAAFTGKSKRYLLSATSDTEKQPPRREKVSTVIANEKGTRSLDNGKKQISFSDKQKEKRNGNLWKSMDAWKEKRSWEDILAPPHRVSSRFSHSPAMSRKSNERVRTLHDKLMSPDKRKKSVVDLKKEAEEKHARAMRIRNELESERVQRLQRTSEKLNRVSEFQAERNMKLREVMHARHRRSELRHEAFLAQVVRRANDESSKVNEVRFITSLNEENKKLMWRQKIHDSELRMAEKRQLLKTKQKEDMAREEAVLERRRLLEAEKLQRIAEIQRKKEEAQVRREEERKASSAAREAKAMEQMRRKEVRAKAQQEEAELLAQKLAERLSESEQRRKFYLEQIRERASMDYRDQTSPFLRRSVSKEGQGRSTPPNSSIEDSQANNNASLGRVDLPTSNMALQHSLKRRIKRMRQKLMALKHEYSEPSIGADVARIGYRTTIGTARAKIGRWLQELQKLRQARKEGATNFGLIAAEMIKFLEGRDAELHASRQAGLVDFIASALPASHTSKPEACQVTLYLLRLLKVVLTMPANRSYFLSQNLLPPVIPMLAAALENYIKIAASVNTPGLSNLASGKSSIENLDLISEILDGFLWIVAAILGHVCSDERQIQMQDGLLELVIAYQVIQHLRDLFALYDRPQVEGSPFPSSIILSIKLLTVMTSRFRNSSSIDWESFPAEITSVNGNEGVKVAEVEDMKGLPDVPEDRPLDDSPKTKENAESLLQMKNSDEVECTNPKRETADVKDENPSIPCNDVTKGFVSLKGDEKSSDKVQDQKEVRLGLKQPVPYLLSVVSETGLVCLPSMLTAVLLQANNRLSSEQISYVLPTNFDEVATGVLKVLNNLALIDIIFIQRMLARPDLKMEFFHLMGFLLSHCTSKWGVATDQVGLLLLESLSLLGYFALFHPENQAVLRWGKSPTILHKVCDLPFVFFSDPELMPVLAGTLIAACFGCDQNKSVILQELSMEMLLSLLKCCKNGFLPPPPAAVQSVSVVLDNHHHHPLPEETGESNQLVAESRTQKSHRFSSRNARTLSQKVAVSSNNTKSIKTRNLRENNKVSKVSEEMGHKQNQHIPETPGLMLMLHNRFPQSFIDRAENFFSIDSCSFTEDDI